MHQWYESTPPAVPLSVRRNRKKTKHRDAQEGRAFLNSIGCNDETSDSRDSGSFTISTISESPADVIDHKQPMDIVPFANGEEDQVSDVATVIFECIRNSLPTASVRTAVSSEVHRPRPLG